MDKNNNARKILSAGTIIVIGTSYIYGDLTPQVNKEPINFSEAKGGITMQSSASVSSVGTVTDDVIFGTSNIEEVDSDKLENIYLTNQIKDNLENSDEDFNNYLT